MGFFDAFRRKPPDKYFTTDPNLSRAEAELERVVRPFLQKFESARPEIELAIDRARKESPDFLAGRDFTDQRGNVAKGDPQAHFVEDA